MDVEASHYLWLSQILAELTMAVAVGSEYYCVVVECRCSKPLMNMQRYRYVSVGVG